MSVKWYYYKINAKFAFSVTGSFFPGWSNRDGLELGAGMKDEGLLAGDSCLNNRSSITI